MPSPTSFQRLLIVRPSALGDVCRSVALLASLRRAMPDAEIDWVVQDSFAPAIEGHPAVSRAVHFPRQRFARWMRSPAAAHDMLRWIGGLRRRAYDVVIDAQGLSRSGLITRFAGAPMRIGHADAREFAWLAYTHRVQTSKRQYVNTSTSRNSELSSGNTSLHTVDRMLALLEPLGVTPVRDMRLFVPPDAVAWWDAERDQRGLLGERYAVFAPTARWPSKRWPIERWRDLVGPLLMRGIARIIVLGAPGEEEQARPLTELGVRRDAEQDEDDSPLLDFVGQTSIAQTMAVIARASLVVANDSAPLHMAVGFDRPCVGLFGPTDPAVVGPYQKPHAALRAFQPKPREIINYRDPKLGDRLMRIISISAVIQQIDRVLTDQFVTQSDGKPQSQEAGNVRFGI